MTGDYRGRKALRAFNNGKGLVELLVQNFGSAYADAQSLRIDGTRYFLSFDKRAQLVAVMLHDRALDSNGILPVVEDIDDVGPIADYELPKGQNFRFLFWSRNSEIFQRACRFGG